MESAAVGIADDPRPEDGSSPMRSHLWSRLRLNSLTGAVSRAGRGPTLREGLTPSRMLLLSFLGLIAAGTIGLKALPGLYTGTGLSWLDALFTATSAVCVTGLIVVDTATHFTLWGQIFLLVLIQLGGLGILTFATLALLAIGKRLSLHYEALSSEMRDVVPDLDTRRLVKDLVLFTFAFEGVGALLLFLVWVRQFPADTALWHSVFHSVSAFCNAGFSTFSDSLIGFRDSPAILGIVMVLVVAGGIGFLTLEEVRRLTSARKPGWAHGLSLNTRLALTVTGGLLVGGAILYGLLEWNNVLAPLTPGSRVLNGMFMSVTARTAGFNTVDYGATTEATNFLTILLMSVGGSPGSTAGGMKTVTFAVIGLLAWARLRGDRVTGVWGRSIPAGTVQRAVGLFALMFGMVTLGVFFLTLDPVRTTVAQGPYAEFLGQMFEAVSAFNTVGLSMGETGDLTASGKLVTVVLMFMGRVGPLTVATALAREGGRGGIGFRFSYEDVMIG